MANKLITDLPASGTPVADDLVLLHTVLDGSEKKTKFSQLVIDKAASQLEVSGDYTSNDQWGQYTNIQAAITRAKVLLTGGATWVDILVKSDIYVEKDLDLISGISLTGENGAEIHCDATASSYGIRLSGTAVLNNFIIVPTGSGITIPLILATSGWVGKTKTIFISSAGIARKAMIEFADQVAPTSLAYLNEIVVVDSGASPSPAILGSGYWIVEAIDITIATTNPSNSNPMIVWNDGSIPVPSASIMYLNASALVHFSLTAPYINMTGTKTKIECRSTAIPFSRVQGSIDQVVFIDDSEIEQQVFPRTGETKGSVQDALIDIDTSLNEHDSDIDDLRYNQAIIAIQTSLELGIVAGAYKNMLVENFVNEDAISGYEGAHFPISLLGFGDVLVFSEKDILEDFEQYSGTSNTGVATSNVTNHLVATAALFQTWSVQVGDIIANTTNNTIGRVTVINSQIDLTLDQDVFPLGTENFSIDKIEDVWVSTNQSQTTVTLGVGGAFEGNQYMVITPSANVSSGHKVTITYADSQNWEFFEGLVFALAGISDIFDIPIRFVVEDENLVQATSPWRQFQGGVWTPLKFDRSDFIIPITFEEWKIKKFFIELGAIPSGNTAGIFFDYFDGCVSGWFDQKGLIDPMDSATPATPWTASGTTMTLGTTNPRVGVVGYLNLVGTLGPGAFDISRTWAGGGTYAPINLTHDSARLFTRVSGVITPGSISGILLEYEDENANTAFIDPSNGIIGRPRKIVSTQLQWQPYEWHYEDSVYTNVSGTFDWNKIVKVTLSNAGGTSGQWSLDLDYFESGRLAYLESDQFNIENYNEVVGFLSYLGYAVEKGFNQRDDYDDIRLVISEANSFGMNLHVSGQMVSIAPYDGVGVVQNITGIPIPNQLKYKLKARRRSIVGGVGILTDEGA